MLLRKNNESGFSKALFDYDTEFSIENKVPPFSREDRKRIKKLYKSGHDKEDIDLIHSFRILYDIIPQTIYDAFMERIYNADEARDFDRIKEKNIGHITVFRAFVNINENTMNDDEKWILSLKRKDDSYSFGQIYHKQSEFGKGKIKKQISGLIYKLL